MATILFYQSVNMLDFSAPVTGYSAAVTGGTVTAATPTSHIVRISAAGADFLIFA